MAAYKNFCAHPWATKHQTKSCLVFSNLILGNSIAYAGFQQPSCRQQERPQAEFPYAQQKADS